MKDKNIFVIERVMSASGHGLAAGEERARVPERARWASEESERINIFLS